MDEAVLIEKVKLGSRASFDALVELHKNRGISIAFNMLGNLEDAKDVLQEAFIKVYLNIKSFRDQSKFSTWFYRIVVNCCLDFLRKRKRANKVFVPVFVNDEGDEIEVADNRIEAKKVFTDNELLSKLDDCIGALPEKQKVCFVLRYRDNMQVSEIAQVANISSSTVKVHIFRAVRHLQDKLAPYLGR